MELHDAPTWEARFALLDREIGARVAAARAPSPLVVWTLRRLVETGGAVSIGTLVDEVGWSAKHLIAQLREQIGLAPKSLARILRFGRAVRRIRDGRASLADLALDCGYYDQAHFTRDARELAGVTPGELVKSLLPDSGGFSVQR